MNHNLSPVVSTIVRGDGHTAASLRAVQTSKSDVPVVLERRFSLFSSIATGITTGNTWAVLGGSIVVAFYNGGPMGIFYEFIAASVCYWFVDASIAELASAVPASGGVYHWAYITAGEKYGRVCAWFAGWLNFFAWTFGVLAGCAISGQIIVYCYSMYHPDFVFERWNVFIVYLILCWLCCSLVMFCTWALPAINKGGSFFTVFGFFATVLTCAIMPKVTGKGYASPLFVFKQWDNLSGYSSDGFAFLLGMLNGAFAVGTPDCVTHMAEEMDNAARDLPIVLLWQVSVGFVTAICYMIAMFFAINDLDEIFNSASIFPLGDIYQQATGLKGGALGLLVVILIPVLCSIIGCYITAGRTAYALARDDVMPFPTYIGSVNERFKSPLWATFGCGVLCTCIGAIYVGSLTAFNAFVGSFVLLTTLSFLLSIGPHLLTKRKSVKPGPFWMGKYGYVVNALACLYMVVFFVIYCFPFAMPVAADGMNYASVITVGLACLSALYWFIHGRTHFKGPSMVTFENMTDCDVVEELVGYENKKFSPDF